MALGVLAAVTGSGWAVLGIPEHATGSLPAFILAAAVGHLLPFVLPRARPVPLSLAVVATFALLGNGPLRVLVVAAAGWSLAALVRWTRGRPVAATDALASLAWGWTLPTLVSLGHRLVPGFELTAASSGDGRLSVGALAAVTVALLLFVPLWAAMVQPAGRYGPLRPLYVGFARSSALGGLALASAAGLGALVHGVAGTAALPLVLLPLLAARSGLRRHALVRRTYDQTIRAMSRVPEVLGAVATGHGERVARIATEVARELGAPLETIAAVERAAYLHELGQLSAEPHAPVADGVAADAGAEVIREAGSMPAVAAMVAIHREPSPTHEDAGVQLGARVVGAVCAFDRGLQRGRSVTEAVTEAVAQAASRSTV